MDPHLEADPVNVLLDRLQQECARVILTCSSVKRLGAGTISHGVTNLELLAKEMSDVNHVWNEIARRLTNNRIGHRE